MVHDKNLQQFKPSNLIGYYCEKIFQGFQGHLQHRYNKHILEFGFFSPFSLPH